MGNVAIRLENLGKMYHIGHVKAPYRTLRETIVEACTAPTRRMRQMLRGSVAGASDLREQFWALKEVSLEVKH
ncbi:MAG: ABC transporter ATP-binding protein, partial [Firmicutes bacterium]|nr:ABC transporter ATP-binding protein [Bacillota bacterium]